MKGIQCLTPNSQLPAPNSRPPIPNILVAGLLGICLLVAAILALESRRALSYGGDGSRPASTPYLGLTYVQLSHEMAARYGLGADSGILVTEVVRDGPAMRAGIRGGDILVEVDSIPLTRATSLVEVLFDKKPGDGVSLQVLRDGQAVATELVLGARR